MIRHKAKEKLQAPASPYPGLRPYMESEEKSFYGRDADSEILIHKILSNRLTLLFAATGVGKSSMLNAAIIPRLKSPTGKNLDVVYYNDWVSSPLEGLKKATLDALQQSGTWPADQAIENDQAEDKKPQELIDFFELCTLFTRAPFIIVLDQFEELFRYRQKYHQQTFEPFIDQLTALITDTSLPLAIVFSMREDFAMELDAFKPKLPTLLFENYYRLNKLGEDAAREAIVTPVENIGYQFEPELLKTLLQDLLSRDLDRDASSLAEETTKIVEPPYLQIVCSQLWDKEKDAPNKTLRLSTYKKVGGAHGLLKNYVNNVLQGFSDREKQITSKAFDHLISRRGTKMAHTPEDLAELTRVNEVELAKVLEKLSSQEIRILRNQQRDKQTWYELYHDMFSDSIESWNTAWKNRMRTRRSLQIIGSLILLGSAAFFTTVWSVNKTSKHLRLANQDESQVEIYSGKVGWVDPFGQHQFETQTLLKRHQLEPDKRFNARTLSDYEQTNKVLAEYKSLENRITAYIQNGDYPTALNLAKKSISRKRPRQAKEILRGLFALKNKQAFQLLAQYVSAPKQSSIEKAVKKLMQTKTLDFPIEKIEDYGFYDEEINNNDFFGKLNLSDSRLNTSIVKRMIERLDDEKDEVRRSAAEALGQFGDPQAVSALLLRLDDENNDVRHRAASALGPIGDPQAVSALLLRLDDEYDNVRRLAAYALGLIGDPKAVSTLLLWLEDENDDVRSSASSSLKQLYRPVSIRFEKSETDKNKKSENDKKTILWKDLNVRGQRQHKELLLNTLNLAESDDRSIKLLELVNNENLHADIRVKAIKALTEAKYSPAISHLNLIQKDKMSNAKVKEAALSALLELENDQSLLNYLEDKTLRLADRQKALSKLAKSEYKQWAIETVLNIAKQDENVFSSLAYRLLGDLKVEDAVELLEERLKTLNDNYKDWRKIRDSEKEDFTEEERNAWLEELNAAKPKNDAMAFDYSYAISRINPEKGKQLLVHPLADVREGAYLGLSMLAKISTLRELDAKRHQQGKQDPIYHFSAFRAIDLGLRQLEVLGEDKELEELKAWRKAVNRRSDDDAVKQRLDWTILMMEHNKKLEVEFKRDYGMVKKKYEGMTVNE